MRHNPVIFDALRKRLESRIVNRHFFIDSEIGVIEFEEERDLRFRIAMDHYTVRLTITGPAGCQERLPRDTNFTWFSRKWLINEVRAACVATRMQYYEEFLHAL